MLTSECRNSIQAEFLPISCVDYCSVISPFALVEIQLLYEYGINGVLRGILNGMQNLHAREDRHIVKLVLQNRTTTSRTTSQETGMFAAHTVFARTVRRLQHRGLSARRPLLRLP
ncbi:hypothetical protein TNCV_3754451 [Trichonephila clavipes]|nr:hypothetical protein TNCV_3754451 [Trichonephila clavipes]